MSINSFMYNLGVVDIVRASKTSENWEYCPRI